jgi:hypothetical protein
VTYVSASAVWRNPNSSYAVASHVATGQLLTLERGQIELTYPSGARLQLTGPFEFLALPAGGKLRRGELVARVPRLGHGFTIETPQGKVVDLGTEFGVVVDDFGVSQVSVFEGKVETLPTEAIGSKYQKIELTSGRAIQWTDDGIVSIPPRGRRYRPLENHPPARQFGDQIRTLIEDRFQSGSLSRTGWKTIGEVEASQHGLRLGNDRGTDQRPYLLTSQEFDPSQGAITVVCDVRFEDFRNDQEASFAILTRSADHLSTPGKPWQDMLARSMRCRIMTDPLSGEGKLQASAKYEADREQTGISWGGFSGPQPNTLYHIEMRDDGLNVSFAVSLAEKPSVGKTITCRSLFRGNQNFIALEGSNVGATVVERLIISQDRATIGSSKLLALPADDESNDLASQNADAAKQLDILTPNNAQLLLTDDFDDGKLDSGKWATLGDVLWKDGQVQLGLPNDEEHIDTWHSRPYLITKRSFDLAAGPLCIVGRATFSTNFLQGYGGSFAVMTRAEDRHGQGPGWENSILRLGVRSNFWPAAYGFDHSLEIHEKPSPNVIAMLAAEAFPISANSRSYVFRVVDDGRSASLTFVDVKNPNIHKTLAHDTSSTLSEGKIAFESCWGSPVLLESVRIYRTDPSKR